MSQSFKRLGQSELLPRYIFAESLFARRRVLEVGAVSSTLGQSARFLSTRGARIVVAADADVEAVAAAQKSLANETLRFRPPVFDDFEGGSFDLVIIADLASYVRAPELLKELARLVAKNGYMMGGLRNPAGFSLANVLDPEEAEAPPTYGMLLDALTPHFASIEVATQSPVLGYQVAFERGEGLQVDGSLAGISEAAYYVVLAGNEPVRNFDPTWVQLPPEPLAFTGGRLEDASQRAREWQQRTEKLKDVLTKKTGELAQREHTLHETTEQLEAAREAVARLTAQIEARRDRPEVLRDREDLAHRITRLEADLRLAVERAIDAEGRAAAAKKELDSSFALKKDAVVDALAAQEQVRIERARREEATTHLEDTRSRLTSAYEELREQQKASADGHVELERARSVIDRLKETVGEKDTELIHARERELKLAEGRSQALAAIESLEQSLSQVRRQTAEATDHAARAEAEKLSHRRAAELESEARRKLENELGREASRAQGLADELARRQEELAALDTEFQAAKAAQTRAMRDIETLANSERSWREVAQQLEQQLNGSSENVQQLTEQMAEAEGERDAERARVQRLEKDLETVVTSERAARSQAEAQLDAARVELKETQDDRDALIVHRDDLQGALSDLEKARAQELERLSTLATELDGARTRVSELDGAVAQARKDEAEAQAAFSSQEKALRSVLEQREIDLNERRAQVEALTRQLAAAQSELGAQRASTDEALETLSAEAREAQSRAEQAHREAVAALEQAQAQAAEQARQDAESQRERHEQALAEALAQHRGAEQAWADEKQHLEAHRASIETEKAAAEQALVELQEVAQLAASRGEELDRRVAELQTQLRDEEERRSSDGDDARANTERLEDELEQAQQRWGEARQRAEEASVASAEAYRALEERLAATETARDEARAATNAQHGRAEAALGTVAELESTLAALREERDAIEASTRTLGEGREEDARRIEALQLELTQARGAATALQALAEDRASALEMAAAERAEVAKALSRAQAGAESLQTELAQGQERVRALEEERQHQAAELEEAAFARGELQKLYDGLVEQKGEVDAALTFTRTEKETAAAELAEALERATATDALLETARTHAAQVDQQMLALKDSTHRELEATRQVASRALDEKNAELESKLQTLRDERTHSLEQQASAYRKSLEEKSAEAEGLLARREAALNEQLQAQQLKTKEVERERENVRDDLEQLRRVGAETRARVEEERTGLNATIFDLKAQVDRAQSETRGHQAGKLSLQNDLEKLRGEMTALRESLARAGGETAAMNEARGQLESELTRLRDRVAAQDAAVSAQVTELQAAQHEVAALKDKSQGLERSLTETQDTVKAAEAAEQAATQARAQLETELRQAQARGTKGDAAAASTKALESALRSMREQVGTLEEQLARLTLERESQDVETQGLQRRASLLEKQLSEAQRSAPQTSDDVSELRNRLPELEAELEINRINSRKDVEAAVNSRRQAEELLLALRVKYGDLQHQVETLQEKFTSATEDVPKLREQVSELSAENEILETEHARLSESVELLEKAAQSGGASIESGAQLQRQVQERDARIQSLERQVKGLALDLEVATAAARRTKTPPEPQVAQTIAPMPTQASGDEAEVFELEVDADEPPEEVVLLEVETDSDDEPV